MITDSVVAFCTTSSNAFSENWNVAVFYQFIANNTCNKGAHSLSIVESAMNSSKYFQLSEWQAIAKYCKDKHLKHYQIACLQHLFRRGAHSTAYCQAKAFLKAPLFHLRSWMKLQICILRSAIVICIEITVLIINSEFEWWKRIRLISIWMECVCA